MSPLQARVLGSRQLAAPFRSGRWSRNLGRDLDDRHARDRLDEVTDVLQRPPPPPRLLRVGRLAVPIVRPRRLLLKARVARAVLALPTVRFEVGGSAGGRRIVESMHNFCGGHKARNLRARSVYVVPADGQPYQGRRAHSRRNAVNRVKTAGIRIESVSPDRLSADTSLHTLGVCQHAPGCDGLTLVAFDGDGDGDGDGGLLAISHVHVDGPVAELHQAVHAEDNPLTDPLRYAMFAAVVKELAANEVLLMVVFRDYLWSSKGVRTYQNVLGYRPVNLRVRLKY